MNSLETSCRHGRDIKGFQEQWKSHMLQLTDQKCSEPVLSTVASSQPTSFKNGNDIPTLSLDRIWSDQKSGNERPNSAKVMGLFSQNWLFLYRPYSDKIWRMWGVEKIKTKTATQNPNPNDMVNYFSSIFCKSVHRFFRNKKKQNHFCIKYIFCIIIF